MSSVLDRAEIEDMFDIEQDAIRTGLGLVENPYPIWKKLLADAPVHEGSLGTLTGLEESATSLFAPGFQFFSVFSFQAVSEVFTRKDDFNSQFYNDMHVNFGDTILGMDGLRHRRYRNLIQHQFQPAIASTWWREKIITNLVEDLVSAFENDEGADLNSQFFARLPMQTVTEGFGFSTEEGKEFRKGFLKTQNHLHDVLLSGSHRRP